MHDLNIILMNCYERIKNSMKNIAILTITDGQNYGNRLQNFALQEVLKKKGYNVETIKRITFRDSAGDSIIVQHLKNTLKRILGRPTTEHSLLRKKRFSKFNLDNIMFSNYILHDNICPSDLDDKYDYFVIGSDQVWNAGFRIIREDIKNHLASFASKEKRIAYAASFGTDKIATGYEQFFKDELPKFKAISVREETGLHIVEECGAKAEVVLDPTMLLDVKEWLNFARKPVYVKEKHYIVTYFLGGRDNNVKEYIEQIADNRIVYNLDIESASEDMIDSKDVFSTTPDEFVWLIANADCVLTDSFHATVFSILFNKPFCVFERKVINESYKIGSRIDTLLGMFHLERFRNSNCSIDVRPENYDTIYIDRVLKQKREKSIDFLKRALNQ